MAYKNINRRSILKAGATAGAVSVAGCFGGDGDTTDISVATAGGSSASELLAALQRVVHNESDTVRIQVEESPGDPANAYLYDQGDVGAYTMSNFNVILASNNEGPFAEESVDKLAHQGIRIAAYNLHWIATEGSGIETTDDLLNADGLYCLPPGWGFRQMVEDVHKEAGMWSDMEDSVLDLDTSDLAGAFDEGRVQASIAYVTNMSAPPGFLREVDARQELQFVESTDAFVGGIQNTSTVQHQEISNNEIGGVYEQDMGEVDPVHTIAQGAQLFFGDPVPVDAAYEVARISHEFADEIIEGYDAYPDHSNIELMYDLYLTDPSLPVHPGMADFLEENGHWNDNWKRAEIDN